MDAWRLEWRNFSEIVSSLADTVFTNYLTPVLLPLVLILATFKLWRVYTDSKDPNSELPLPPGNMGYPIIGETLQLMKKGSDFFRERSDTYGRIYKTHILGERTIRVSGARNIAKILKGEGELVTSKWPYSTRLILGDGALAHSHGEAHTWRRQMIARAFTTEALSSYTLRVQVLVQDAINAWCTQGTIHGFVEARSLTFTIAAKILLGFEVDDIKKHQLLILFEDLLTTLFAMPIPLPGIGLYKGLKARRRVMREIDACIAQRIAHDEFDRPDDALALILEASEDSDHHLTPSQVRDSALEMLFAGHLPTSSAVSSALMFLGQDKKVYATLCMELEDNGLLDPSVELSYSVINSLPYVQTVVNEILRVAPPVGAGYRKVLQTFELDGCQIPKGWSVVYSIRETHHGVDPEHNPLKFDPDRWQSRARPDAKSPEQQKKQIPDEEFNFIPYGWGQRACVGQKYADMFIKVFVIELVRNVTVRLENGATELLYFPVPHPRDHLPLQVRPAPYAQRRRAFTNSW